ncbi:type III secretion system chaperone [Ramlibacter rhizophilus]|uniref:Type III secretion chaperone SycN n=1 Tax=Ramlibacter rhizophilus TaxID=1781167 RepID=A0A4Z0BCP8_9BURK|nr:type III secretion system chaperone [Ramlibacter rhizophilus]TFY96273.1 hypothetical protein EZ242_21750 [Ramlibacter rhizophilus]
MSTQTVLNELGRALGLAGLPLDTSNSCALRFGGDVQVDMRHEPEAQALCLATEVDLLSPRDRGRCVNWLLRANLDLRATGDAWFARRGAAVVLCRSLADDLGPQALADELARLVTACREWRSRLDQFRSEAA